MTAQEATHIQQGSHVLYRGKVYTVSSVRIRGIAAPYFRLNGLEDGGGMVSYILCELPSQAGPSAE